MLDNLLYFGDNLDILREHFQDESVDLIYLDPPFNSNREYNVLYKEPSGLEADAQIRTFEDTWRWTMETERAFDDLGQVAPPRLVEMMNGFVGFLGRNDLTAYLVMLALRLVELHRVLKPNGSLFLHCDPTAGHYIKIALDCIFGKDKMINEIVWQRTAPKSHAYTRMPRSHDIIFWYAKGDSWTFNPQYAAYDQEYLDAFYRHVEEGTGRRYRLDNVQNPNKNRPNLTYEWKGVTRVRRWTREKMEKMDKAGRLVYSKSGLPSYKRYLDEMPGVPVTDNWTDIAPVQGSSREALGYQTQKPIALLKRIVAMVSNPGDTILDPFCGCGTTIVAAEALGGRRWIGIDITHLAISSIRNRLGDMFPGCNYKVIGEPTTISGARELAHNNRHQFEWWAISLVGARPAGGKARKGADSGIDGVLFFPDPKTKKQTKVVVQVKSGKVGAKEVRDFRGVIEREKAPIGLFLTLEKPTQPMQIEASQLGMYKVQFLGVEHAYPRLQILTLEDLLEKKARPELPYGASAGLKSAERFQNNPESLTSNMFDHSLAEDDALEDDGEL
jgi:DNA modification methylase